MKNMVIAIFLCLLFGGLPSAALGETVIVDDHFDDGAIGTNATGTGTGFTAWTGNSGAVTESESSVTLSTSVNGGDRAMITSIEGAAFESGIARFEFRGVSFAAGNTSGGATARNALGVQEDGTAYNFDDGMKTGFWIQFENDSLSTDGGSGGWNGTSALIYEASDNTKTVLATWEFDTLNWDSGTQNFTPVLDITLDLEADSYTLTIEGDTVTLLSGSLSDTFAAAGITNELTTGHAFMFIQSENPGINMSADQIIVKEDAAVGPHSPAVLPDNGDGSSGTLLANNSDVEVTLTFKAAGDPDRQHEPQYPVNPDILGHYILLSDGGANDPNVYLLDYVPHVHDADPYLTNPDVSYGPITLVNGQGKKYYWQVEEAMNDGTGNPYPLGEPNNITGSLWSFAAVGAEPHILTGPVHTYTDAAGNATLAVTTGAVANNFRWFKVVGSQDSAENGETDDLVVSDGGIYANAQTNALAITGGTLTNGAEGRYYCVAYNGDPDGINIPSGPSPVAWVWLPRLVNHYPFEVMNVVDGNSVTPDIVSGYDMMMMSNDTGLDIPALEANAATGLAGSTQSLKFDNPRANPADPNNVDAQYAQVNEPWAGSYEDITLSAWVYSNGGSNWNRILDFGNDNANYMFLCVNPGSVNGAVRFAVNIGGTEQSVTSPAGALPDGEWTYITATLSGDTGRLYINGELVATNTALTNDPVRYGPTTQNWLGRSQWGAGDGYFNGLVDELKIYNYALTTEQVAQDYLDVRGEWICNRELYDLPYDFNGDCTVSLEDFAIFAATWLDNYRFYREP